MSMKMMKSSMIAIAVASLLGTGTAMAAGTKQEQDACSKDAVRFCRPLLSQGDLAVLSCLQQNRPKLKRVCQAVLTNNGV